MKITEATIAAALADPDVFGDVLADVLNNRGHRDAAIVLTSRTGNWEALKEAAVIGAMHAAVFGQHSVHGPLTVLATAIWVAPDGRDPSVLLAAVPSSDPAWRMASLVQRLQANGVPAQEWTERMAGITVAECLAFQPVKA